MTTLTREHLDESLDGLRQDIKAEIINVRDELAQKIETEVGGLATMVANGFADLEGRLDVRERVEHLETKMKKVESALNAQF